MKNSEHKRLLVATNNKGKLKEIREILDGVEVLGLSDLPISIEIEEDGDTFEANALKKANTLMHELNVPVLADDSGLSVDALGGRPGIYSARYAGEDATDEDNMKKLLEEMARFDKSQRTARFVCVMCLVLPDGTHHTVRGETEGRILEAPRGENGFGYDPLFFNEEYGKTFAELSSEEKHAVSHRGRALAKMCEILNQIR